MFFVFCLRTDENGRRNLLQTNQDVALAIRGALDATGAGDGSGMLDVIGFDACLMQAVGAADDYKGVAKYILASEAVEPGHGWAYSYLNTAGSALELAQNIVETFVSQTQGGSYHQTPKTLAIVDSSKFDIFIAAFENFSANMLSLLKGGDKTLHTQLSRARSQSVAFEGIVDAVGSRNPSAVDIGSFLYQFKTICNPGGTLQTDLDTAIGVYYDMLVLTRNGPGTAGVTGMHITWPNQGEFASNPTLWNQVLFNNANYVTSIIPNFREFLSWYLPAGSQAGEIGGDSVCGKGVESPPEQTVSYPDALIQEASGVINPTTGMFEVKTTISPDVSEMRVEYGIDLSTPLKPVLEEKGYIPTDDEHLILLGGDVAGVYDGAQFDAAWDQKFYFLNITGTDTFEALYVADQGGGSKKIPTMYFTDDFREELSELQFLDFLFFDFAGWVEKGARYGFLQFSTDEASGRINDNLSLYISNADGVFSEQPRSAGGMLIPLVYVDAYIQERTLDTLPGGFYQTVIEWSTELDYNILTTSIENVFNIVPDTDAVTISVYAFNHADPAAAVDSKIYDVKRNRGSKPCLSDCTSQSGSSAESDTLQSQNVESSAKATCLSMIAAGVSIMILGFFL